MLAHMERERKRMRLTQEMMARRLMVSRGSYLAYVHEKRPVPSDVLLRMARLCGCTVDHLLYSTAWERRFRKRRDADGVCEMDTLAEP